MRRGNLRSSTKISFFQYLPTWQKILESAVFVPLCIYGIFSSFGYLELPDQETIKNGSTINKKQLSDSLPVDKFVMSGVALPLRHRVFNIYACVFSIEFIYKMITRLDFIVSSLDM